MKVREVGMFSNLFPLDPQSNRHQSFCHQSKLPSIWWLTSCYEPCQIQSSLRFLLTNSSSGQNRCSMRIWDFLLTKPRFLQTIFVWQNR